jgi:REP element-mobilizing transposase RayT
VGEAITRNLVRHGDRCLALAVGKTHAHLLVEVPDDWDAAKKLASRVKQASSRAVGTEIPGVIWSRGGAYIRIENKQHQKKVFHYILNHATKENAWVWEFRNRSQS